jgi:hypothetical protein
MIPFQRPSVSVSFISSFVRSFVHWVVHFSFLALLEKKHNKTRRKDPERGFLLITNFLVSVNIVDRLMGLVHLCTEEEQEGLGIRNTNEAAERRMGHVS